MQKIVVVDMDSGNLHSVAKAVQSVAGKAEVEISNSLSVIEKADRLIVPGQGAIHTWMNVYNRLNENDRFKHALQAKPVFGICVGMQAMFSTAEEGAKDGNNLSCLDFFQGHVKRFESNDLTIPQMGWNQVKQHSHENGQDAFAPLWQGIEDNAWFYFAHSFHASEDNLSNRLGSTEYGIRYTSVSAKDNVVAVQFHPEKSQKNGLQIIENFIHWNV